MTRTKPDLATTVEQPPKRKLPIGIPDPEWTGKCHEDGGSCRLRTRYS